jgi:HK97 family phage major capsid protein
MPVNTVSIQDQIINLSEKSLRLVQDTSRPWLAADGDVGRKHEVEAMEADIHSLQEQFEKYTASDATLKQFQGIADQNAQFGQQAEQRVKSLGEQLTESGAFQQAQKGGRFQTGAIELKAGEILGETAFSGTGSLTSTSGAAGLLVPQYLTTPVQKLFQRLTVADLMPTGVITGSSLIYPIESTATNLAATVAEGGLKPASVLGLTNVTELMHKIATRLKISDETLQDIPAIQSYVNARLVLFVKIKEEQQLLSGAGTGSELLGLVPRTTAAGQTTVVVPATGAPASGIPSVAQKLEAIYQQITNIRVNAFIEPDAMVMDPVSWQQLRIGKDLNGQYYGGGPFTGAYGQGAMVNDNSVLSAGGQDVWQLRTVVTSAMTAGTALIGGFQTCAQVFRKGGLTVEMTNSNEDDFNNNLVSIRAEERLLLADYRPGGFGRVTGLNNAAG